MSKVARNIARIVKGDVVIDFSYGAIITKPIQLGLPFDQERAVFSVDGSEFNLDSLLYITKLIETEWVFDLRVMPRFDRIPGGRNRVFTDFAREKIHYIDLIGMSPNKINPISPLNWVPVISTLLGQEAAVRGPFVGIFEDVRDAAAMLGTLEKTIYDVAFRRT